MRERIGWIAAVVLLIVGATAIYGYNRVVAFAVETVTDDVHVIYGLGGNVGILATGRGTVVVDTMTFSLQGKQIREQAQYLHELDGDYWQGDASGTLPNETFQDNHVLRIGGKTIRLHHLGSGHTDGDLVVVFAEDRVIHTGDCGGSRDPHRRSLLQRALSHHRPLGRWIGPAMERDHRSHS